MASVIAKMADELISPILQEMNLELFDIEYVKEGKNRFLRVFIDSPSGVDLDTCAEVSEKLSEALDVEDPIKEAYFLEVSSPGAERPLKRYEDFEKALGKNVHLTTYEPIEGNKVFEGKLTEVNKDYVVLAIKNKTRVAHVTLPFDKIASSRLAIIF
ncbi:ribosome maturation factor RimP [Sporolactobacillus inulinus]|jgi:ribosome maturation factor RimP|uniref:Ribosome maturation factor RimP n=2 Tax=Sporolactobacillus inulinus TaxID=2078 RepID=A0A4Y3T2U2_9BACL|nr:ribosome maturation factor RimP [Sporolactobacillus inulinus]KLI03121.1 ribosome maturation factor RimP [Sporolactobacillus inulinus CASD]GAY74592.1 clustered with transcription termination protein NusA [Sporolactobacillus inulinus]GEB75934.1 ribosome maturation factor RimP [Sporolactobacillus inulinus]